MRRINLDIDPPRSITDETCAFGYACCEGQVHNGRFYGEIAGNLSTLDKAQHWLAGQDVELDVKPAVPGRSWV